MNFDTAFDRLIGHEGGYANHPADPGGETMWGVTKRVAVAYGYTGEMRDLPRETAKHIAKLLYWDAANCDALLPAIAWQVFDTAYNSGVETALRLLQRAAGVADDGHVGPVTMAAISALPITDLLARYNGERLDFMTRLSTWPSFGKGWARRIANNLRYEAEDA
jgi:lysozyme family protein